MIPTPNQFRTPCLPRLRCALLGVLCVGTLALAGCGSDATTAEVPSPSDADQAQPAATPPAPGGSSSTTVLAALGTTPPREMPLGASSTPPASMHGMPDQMDHPLVRVDTTRKPASIAVRSSRRAYLGAPPVIPHGITDQMSARDCMACHETGLKTGELVVPPLPHPYLANCTQCHVEAKAAFGLPAYLADNSFDGLAIPMQGDRAWDGAPPTIPHPMWMRDNCLACHGPTARPGLETTHPWRANCTQCHVPTTSLVPTGG